MANSCGSAARWDDVGRERFAVLYRMLLIVFQRARRFDEKDWTSILSSILILFNLPNYCFSHKTCSRLYNSPNRMYISKKIWGDTQHPCY